MAVVVRVVWKVLDRLNLRLVVETPWFVADFSRFRGKEFDSSWLAWVWVLSKRRRLVFSSEVLLVTISADLTGAIVGWI